MVLGDMGTNPGHCCLGYPLESHKKIKMANLSEESLTPWIRNLIFHKASQGFITGRVFWRSPFIEVNVHQCSLSLNLNPMWSFLSFIPILLFLLMSYLAPHLCTVLWRRICWNMFPNTESHHCHGSILPPRWTNGLWGRLCDLNHWLHTARCMYYSYCSYNSYNL